MPGLRTKVAPTLTRRMRLIRLMPAAYRREGIRGPLRIGEKPAEMARKSRPHPGVALPRGRITRGFNRRGDLEPTLLHGRNLTQQLAVAGAQAALLIGRCRGVGRRIGEAPLELVPLGREALELLFQPALLGPQRREAAAGLRFEAALLAT